MGRALIVSAGASSNEYLCARLTELGYTRPLIVPSGAEARRRMLESDFELIVVNAPLPDPVAGQQVMLRVADMLGTVSLVGMVLLALVAVLWLLRKVCIAGRLRREETWGCGYQYGTPRVQYTDASFSEPLGRIFGGAMGLKVHQELDAHYFPGKASVAISAPDRLRTGLFTPLFEGVEKLCNMCKILQHGKIHLYILYILATLVALLAWGLHA